MTDAQVDQVRRFNRMVTQRTGALDDHFLGRDRPLGESRLLFEIGTAGAALRDLRARLGLDAGYLTRLIQALEGKGLIRPAPGSSDGRLRRVRLTAAGRREIGEMNRRADGAAQALLQPLTADQRARLVAAMEDVHRLLQVAGLRIERIDPASPEARWCVRQYFEELNRRFETGFDPAASLPNEDRDLLPPRGAFLVASVDGDAVACGAVKTLSPGAGYLKRMWVSDGVRGLGIGRRMLSALEAQARGLGFTTVCLETNRTLQEALRLYRSAGYRDVAPFNDEPYAHHWLEKRLA